MSAIRRPYPTGSGDGTYPDEHKEDGGWLDVFGSLNIENWESLIATAQKQLTGDDWDDREYLMERIIQVSLILTCDGSMLIDHRLLQSSVSEAMRATMSRASL